MHSDPTLVYSGSVVLLLLCVRGVSYMACQVYPESAQRARTCTSHLRWKDLISVPRSTKFTPPPIQTSLCAWLAQSLEAGGVWRSATVAHFRDTFWHFVEKGETERMGWGGGGREAGREKCEREATESAGCVSEQITAPALVSSRIYIPLSHKLERFFERVCVCMWVRARLCGKHTGDGIEEY